MRTLRKSGFMLSPVEMWTTWSTLRSSPSSFAANRTALVGGDVSTKPYNSNRLMIVGCQTNLSTTANDYSDGWKGEIF